ncbi:UNVERIFIED_CONTAM: hypothetical protein GTU68_042462 [Idotea baltica]|nr:hypothetical protein [Idotea baltica]
MALRTHRISLFLTVAFSGLSLISLAVAEDYSSEIKNKSVQAEIINNDAKKIGMITVRKASGGVLIHIKAQNMPAGFHGMHFHKKGDCSDHMSFKSAEGHIDPHSKPHGFLNIKGPHEGNLPNLIVGKDGTVEVELYSTLVTIGEGDSDLIDEDGSALIVHINPDDHFSQPIGGSGGRIACAVIRK